MIYTHIENGKEISADEYNDLSANGQKKYQPKVSAAQNGAQRREMYGKDLAAWFQQQQNKGSLRGAPGVPPQYRIDGWVGELSLKSLQIVETPEGATTRFVATHDDGSTFKGSISPQNPPTRFPEKGDTVSVQVRTYVRTDGQTAYVADIVEPGA